MTRACRAGSLPGAGGWSVAVQDLVLFLFHALVVPSGLTTSVQPHPVDHDLVVERAEQDAVATDVFRRRPCAWCGAPRRPRRAGCSPRPTGSAGPAAAPRSGSPPGPSRSSRCPAAGSARPAAPPAAAAAGSWPARPGRTAGRRPCRSRPARPPPTPAVVSGRGSPPWRSLSSSTQSRTRFSRASMLTSPVTMGAIAASQAMAPAASPSSQAPSFTPVSAACARRAAHRARTRAVHCSCSAELPCRRSRSARVMCTQVLTGCPARSGSSPPAVSRRIASASASWYRCPLDRSSSFPAGAASASSTAATSLGVASRSGPPRGTGTGLLFGTVIFAVAPLGLNNQAANPWLPGSTADPLGALAWILLFGGPAGAAVLAARPGSPATGGRWRAARAGRRR